MTQSSTSDTLASEDDPAGAAPPLLPPPRRRRWVLAGVAVVLILGVAGVAAAYGIDFGGRAPAPTSTLPPSTTTVTRTTLTATEKVNGTLGYGDPVTLTGRGTGVLTWLPAAGAAIDRGGVVYRVNDRPIPLLLGTLPTYRVLRSGVSGADVAQLEENLAALGYGGFTVDQDFNNATGTAVQQWQRDLGLDQTGTVEPGAVVVGPGPVRIATVRATVGDPVAAALLTYTGTTRAVTVDLDVSKQQLVKPGLKATVTLPDNSTVEGDIANVGTVASTSGGTGGQPATTTIDVVVSVADQAKLGTLDAAPVSVTLVADRRENVLTVPVAALVALAEGGYGVQVVADGFASYVAVNTGMFAGGRVEISGDGIDEGTVVGIPT